MKNLLTLIILILSVSLQAQGDIMALMLEINGQPERVNGYSKMVTLSYGSSYDEEAPIDTTIVNEDGSTSELTLTKKTVVVFGDEYDVQYEISVRSNDTTMITTTSYNDMGKVITQSQDLGDDEMSAIFNSDKVFTYDDQSRILSMTSTAGGESSGGTFTYNEDGLPQTVSMDLGMGKFNVTRKEMEDYFIYEITGEMSNEMEEMMAMMGKTLDDMPKEFFEVRKKGDLYEFKQMKEVGEEKVLTLQAMTIRDVEGKLHEEIKYNNEEIIEHKKYTHVDGKLTTIEDVLDDTKKVIEYDKNGNPLNAFENFTQSNMTYNKDGMLATKSSSSTFSDGISGLEVMKYYK